MCVSYPCRIRALWIVFKGTCLIVYSISLHINPRTIIGHVDLILLPSTLNHIHTFQTEFVDKPRYCLVFWLTVLCITGLSPPEASFGLVYSIVLPAFCFYKYKNSCQLGLFLRRTDCDLNL